MKKIIVMMLVSMLAATSSATIINIPADYPTIQDGVVACNEGDTVLVQPGLYFENITFIGHNIVLGSLFLTTGDRSYIASTIIDGDSSGSVVTFQNYEDSTALINGFTITRGNTTEGGGIICINSNPTISNNIITLNLSYNYGAGIHCYYSNPVISYNEIYDNTVLFQFGRGGGIYCGSSEPRIYNNVIYDNISAGMGGGVSCAAGDPELINNVVYGNTAGGGGGIYGWAANPAITNCILWGNTPTQIHMAGGSDPAVSYCDIDSYWPGVGNIRVDPDFRDPGNGDFHLMSTACGDPNDSPCIDAGDPSIQDYLLGCSWGLGSHNSDMGAYGGGDSAITSIFDNMPSLPDRFILLQNYPNPFNAQTTVRFVLSQSQNVELAVYDLLGRQVAILIDENRKAGVHNITFDASFLSSGVYFYCLQARDAFETKRMVLLK